MTVNGYLKSIIAALNWAVENELLESVPKIRKLKTAKLKVMKGRPISLEEFERMLTVIPKIVGREGTAPWRFLLRGLWESGLRLGELVSLSWDDPLEIRPIFRRGADPVLEIPAERLVDAGVPEREVSRVMRHVSPETTKRYYATGTVQKSSAVIRRHLAKSVPEISGTVSSSDDVSPVHPTGFEPVTFGSVGRRENHSATCADLLQRVDY